MASSDNMGDGPNDEYYDNINSERTRLCFEYLGWSTTQWDDPCTELEKREEQLIEIQAELTLLNTLIGLCNHAKK
jgi:hypothetical protein